jgi:cytochrome c551/c552
MTPHEHSLRGCLLICAAAAFALLCLGAAAAYVVVRAENRHVGPTGYAGDPERGRALVQSYGCLSCHENGAVGPALDDIGARSYLGGKFPNVPGVMQQWIRHPQSLKPGTVMPDLGVSARDADDMAAYLATLR